MKTIDKGKGKTSLFQVPMRSANLNLRKLRKD